VIGGFAWFPPQASTIAGRVDDATLFVLAVCSCFALLIAALICYFGFKYHHSKAADRAHPVHVNVPIEIVWTGIPLLLAIVMFVWGARLFIDLHQAPANAIEINVVGKQWMWKIQHPQGRREINTLHVPLGQPVKLVMSSEDVIHSFFVPAFRVKQDVLPARYTTVWFEANQLGSFPFYCAQLCGTFHAEMIGTVIVMKPDAYNAWVVTPDSATAFGTPVADGRALFGQYACASCHGVKDSGRGPSLTEIFGKTVTLQDGKNVKVDENYLRESILLPRAKIVAGYSPLMPTYEGQINNDQIQSLIAYLKSGAQP
jgi:cytochrome c oxidase subunit 2